MLAKYLCLGAVCGLALLVPTLLSRKYWNRTKKRKQVMLQTKVKSEKLDDYLKYHRGVWPEVESGLRKYGIKLLTIYQSKEVKNSLCMFIEMDENLDLSQLGVGSEYRKRPRVGEWETLMDSFFEGGSWNEMQPVYTLTEDTSSNTESPCYTT